MLRKKSRNSSVPSVQRDTVVELLPRLNVNRSVAAWMQHIQTLHYRTMELSLERIQTVIDRIVLRDRVPFRVVSVGGTNGKGSVATMLESVFRHAGLKTGLYTSPHLVHFNERFVVNGRRISDSDLIEQFEKVERFRGDVPLTFFEFGTAIAVDYFASRNVDVAILEVGLGGRKDAVNVFDADIACITSIGIDHANWLGNTREKIGFEKAGILRAEQLAVIADADCPRSVRNVVQQLSVKAVFSQQDFKGCWNTSSEHSWDLTVRKPQSRSVRVQNIPVPSTPGNGQRSNAEAAATAAVLARKYFDIPDRAIRKGIGKSRVSGRLEIVQSNPEVLLDVAHNGESVSELTEYLAANEIDGRNIAVMSALADKQIENMIHLIKKTINVWHLCGIHDERGISARNLFRRVQPQLDSAAQIELHFNAVQAYEAALQTAGKQDRIVVFGSFLTVGDIMAHRQV